MITKHYKYEELFFENLDDPGTVLFQIPQDMLDKYGWVPGDEVTVTTTDERLIIKKHE